MLALLAKAQLDSGQVDAFRETRSRALLTPPVTTADFVALGNLQTYCDRKSAMFTLDDVVSRSKSPLAVGIRAELLWKTALNQWDLEVSGQALKDIEAAVRIQPNLRYPQVTHAYSLMAQMLIVESLVRASGLEPSSFASDERAGRQAVVDRVRESLRPSEGWDGAVLQRRLHGPPRAL